MDNLNPLLVFLRVVEQGSFTKAAEDLGLSRSGISKQIQQLEKNLNTRLLTRTTRSISPTEVGQLVYQSATRIKEELNGIDDLVHEYQDSARGTLKIAAPKNFGRLHIAPHLKQFNALYPDINVILSLGDQFVDIVKDGIDIAFRISELRDSELIMQKVADNPVLLVAAPSYLEEFGIPQCVEDLANHNCLYYYTSMHTFDRWSYHDQNEIRHVSLSGRTGINDAESIVEAVIDGAGIAMATHYIAYKGLRSGQLTRVLPAIRFLDSYPISMLYPERKLLPPKTRAFINYIKETIGDPPYWLV